MLVAKALGKIEKLRGGDALEQRWYEAPVYRYTLEKEVSELTEEGHGWEWNDNGEIVVYELDDGGWARATVYPFDSSDMAMKAVFMSPSGSVDVCSISGVENVEKEVIGRTEWDITVDVADGTIVDVERTEIRNEQGERPRGRATRLPASRQEDSCSRRPDLQAVFLLNEESQAHSGSVSGRRLFYLVWLIPFLPRFPSERGN